VFVPAGLPKPVLLPISIPTPIPVPIPVVLPVVLGDAVMPAGPAFEPSADLPPETLAAAPPAPSAPPRPPAANVQVLGAARAAAIRIVVSFTTLSVLLRTGRQGAASPDVPNEQITNGWLRIRFAVERLRLLTLVQGADVPRDTALVAAYARFGSSALVSQRLWCAASVARRAALRLLSGSPDISHPFSDVAGPPDRPRCHANFARHPWSETHKPSLRPLDPVPPRSETGRGPLRPEPCDSPTFHSRAANRY
jgi:hypothetical protein